MTTISSADYNGPTHPLPLISIGGAVVAIIVIAPLVGWPGLVRLQAVLVPALALVALFYRPWRWDRATRETVRAWWPSRQVVFMTAAASAVILYWAVLTAFRSGQINAIDFTVYFDRPTFQTLHGRPLFIESADTGTFTGQSALSIHAFWVMLPLAALYAIDATPQWLLALSVIAVVGGALHVLRILRHLGAGGVMACATALAFVLNDNTARTLGYGFHPEVLYAWFVPWMLDAGLRRKPVSFVVATLCCVSVKEDAAMPIFAVSSALALHGLREMAWREKVVYLAMPLLLSLANLAIYYRWVMPFLRPGVAPSYAVMWANYGPTPMLALVGMATHPWRVVTPSLTSGFLRRVIVPHLFLPVLGWRWAVGIVPIVALYGASANEQLRSFGIYYAIVLVPFLVIGASMGALKLARWVLGEGGGTLLLPATAILLGALLLGGHSFGGGGYSLRPWRAELAAVPNAMAALAGERRVLVQSGLYTRAGYDERVQLLTPNSVRDSANAGAMLLLAPGISAYPLTPRDVEALARSLTPAGPLGSGLLAVRLPPRAVFSSWRDRRSLDSR